jgi:hypothetical protein
MRAYVGIIDETGLRAFVPDDDPIRRLMVVGPRSACIWAALADESAREIVAELRGGHRSGALSLLLNQAFELVPIGPADPASWAEPSRRGGEPCPPIRQKTEPSSRCFLAFQSGMTRPSSR